MASSSPSAASASAPRVMRVTTPGAIQVVCYGFFLLTTLFFGTVYILAPYQLVRAAKLPEGSLSPAVEAWVHMVVRGWGAGTTQLRARARGLRFDARPNTPDPVPPPPDTQAFSASRAWSGSLACTRALCT